MLVKLDGNKCVCVSNEKFVDVNLVGIKCGYECILILMEGDFVRVLVVVGCVVLDLDCIGVFFFCGKMLNVCDVLIEQIMKNKEIENIKKFLGLKYK